MRTTLPMAALFATLFGPGLALAEQCPVTSPEDTIEVLEHTKSCKEANKLLGLCSWTTSMDVQFSEVVIKKCEKDFLPGASKARASAYRKELDRCERKYAHKSGTMYVSFAATCQAAVAAKYSGH